MEDRWGLQLPEGCAARVSGLRGERAAWGEDASLAPVKRLGSEAQRVGRKRYIYAYPRGKTSVKIPDRSMC